MIFFYADRDLLDLQNVLNEGTYFGVKHSVYKLYILSLKILEYNTIYFMNIYYNLD